MSDHGGVDNDYTGLQRDRREFDLKRAVRRFLYPAVVVYFGMMIVAAGILGGSTHLVDVLVGMVAIGFLVGCGVLGLAIRGLRKQADASDMGYNVQDGSKPMFALGQREYERYRIDTGASDTGTSARSQYRDVLAYRRREQRGMECKVCQSTIGRNGGYFVEHRSISRIFGIQVREQIHKTDAYCSAHKPEEFQ